LLVPYAVTKRRGLGFGDVKLAAICGLLLGYPRCLAALWCAFVFGGVWAVALLLSGRATRSTPLPLAPFLATGAGCALLLKGTA
jgi:leader peptidase (prepilin peptidase) / N-methyltransferase